MFFMEELSFSSTNIGTIDTISHDKLKYTKYFEYYSVPPYLR